MIIMMRLPLAAIVMLISSLTTQGRAAEPIRIGLSGPFTGGSASMGTCMRDGVRLAVSEINAKGGVLGRPIQLIERDDEARNELGVQIAQELIEKERVIAALGFVNTGVALASQRFYQEAEIPVISNSTTGTLITKQFLPPDYPHNYIFRVGLFDAMQADAMADEAIDRRHFKSVAILGDSTNYGQLGRADLEAALAKRQIKPVAVEKFNLKDIDMTAQILRAKQAGAEAILAIGIGPELGQIANGLAKLGLKLPLIGSNPMAMSSFLDIAGPNAEGARMPQSFIQEGTTPARQAFISAYQKTYHVERMSNPPSAAQGYDSVLLLVAAIAQAKSTKGDLIRAALEDLQTPIDGMVARYDHPFSANDHESLSAGMAVIGEVKAGRIVFAYEDERKAASILRSKAKN
jgi:branched-chain amino acid transport system substrate-binding protein